jgi:hypothetical protein
MNERFQSRAIFIGVKVSNFFNLLKASMHSSVHKNLMSLANSTQKGLAILEISLMNLLQNSACPKKLLTPLTIIGGGSFEMMSIFALSTSMPLLEIT